MKPITRRIISGLIAMLISLTAVASTLPAGASFDAIPVVAWLTAMLSFLTGFYSPKAPEPLPDEKESVPPQEKPQ